MTQVNADKEEEITETVADSLGRYLAGGIEYGPVEGTSFPLIYQHAPGVIVECTVSVDDINVYFGEG